MSVKENKQSEKTGYKDKHGKDIHNGENVVYQGDVYEVYENPFTQRFVIDNDCGQCELSDVHNECEIILEKGDK